MNDGEKKMTFEDWAAGRMEVPHLAPFTATDHDAEGGFLYPGDFWIESHHDRGVYYTVIYNKDFESEDLGLVERWLWDNLVAYEMANDNGIYEKRV